MINIRSHALQGAVFCLLLGASSAGHAQTTTDIDSAERMLDALQAKLSRLQNQPNRSAQIKAAIDELRAEPAFLSAPINYTVKAYNKQTAKLTIWAQTGAQSQQELTFKVDPATAAAIQQQATLNFAYFLHPQLGRTLLAAVLTTANGKRLTQALLDWPALADRLMLTSIYGHCPLGRSLEQLRNQGAVGVPIESVQGDFAKRAKTSLQSLKFPANSEYAALLDAANIGFDIKVNIDKNKLRLLGLSGDVLNARCASCDTYSAAIESPPYDHGYTQDRQHRQNPAARQAYTLAFALPTRTPAFEVDADQTTNQAPVFLYFDNSGEARDIPPACAPKALADELSGLRNLVSSVKRRTLEFAQLPKLIADMDARKARLSQSVNNLQYLARRRRWAELASGSALAQKGRCLEVDAEQQKQALAMLQNAEVVVRLCEDCDDRSPRLLQYKPIKAGGKSRASGDWQVRASADGRDLATITSKAAEVDLADLYVGKAGQTLINMANVIGCRTFFRSPDLTPDRYQGLLLSLDAKRTAEQERLELANAKAAIATAKRQQNERQFSQAAATLEAALRQAPAASQAQQKLLQAYTQLGKAIDSDSVDGSAAARAHLQAREFSNEVEAQLVADPQSLQGAGIYFDGAVLENVLHTGDLVQVRQGRLIVTPINPKLKTAYPIGSQVTVYGRIVGEFTYAPGRSLPKVEAVWIDAR